MEERAARRDDVASRGSRREGGVRAARTVGGMQFRVDPPHVGVPASAATPSVGGLAVRRVLLTLLLTALMVSTGLLLWSQQQQRLVEHWQGQLDLADDAQAVATVQRLGQLGRAAVPAVVAAADSPRQIVAEAAQHEIAAWLARWEQASPEHDDAQAAALCEEIARQMAQFTPPGQAFAAQIARRVIERPVSSAVAATSAGAYQLRLTAACERILDELGGQIVESPQVSATPPPAATMAPTEPNPLRTPAPTPAPAPPADIAETPLVPPPIETSPPPAESTSDDENSLPRDLLPAPPVATRVGSEPRRLFGNVTINPERHGPPRTIPREDASQERNDLKTDAAPTDPRKFVPLSSEEAAPRDEPSSNAPEGATALQSADAELVAQAVAQFRRQGLDEAEIKVLRGAVDADPAARRRAVTLLPRLAHLDPTPWLEWLATDDDGEVRLAALTTLATAADEETLRRLRTLWMNEPDASIRDRLAPIFGRSKR